MQIFLQAEAEMAQALHIIAGFLHAAQHICGKHIKVVRSLRFLQQLLKLSWIDVADIDDERIAQRLGNLRKSAHLLRLRLLMHAVHGR